MVVPKMLIKGAVQYIRVGALFAFVLAVVSAAPLRAAATTYNNPAYSNEGTILDRFLPLSLSDYFEPVDHLSTVTDADAPGGVQSLVYTPEGGQESDDFSTVARHRGFRKFFLLVFVCGGIIRFFTSPTFITFIRDALDPRSW